MFSPPDACEIPSGFSSACRLYFRIGTLRKLLSCLILAACFVFSAKAGVVTASFNSPGDVPVVSPVYDATGNELVLSLGFQPQMGTELTVVRNTGLGFISGRFSNLAQGQIVHLAFGGGAYSFAANYYGGSGNDLVLSWSRQRLYAWGAGSYGNLGSGDGYWASVPVEVDRSGVLGEKTVVGLSTRGAHNLALCADGTLVSWGGNDGGQLGNGTTTHGFRAALVDRSGVLAGREVVAVAAGGRFSMALCSDGTVVAWGANESGQLGNGGTANSLVPVALNQSGAMAGKTVVAISAGDAHALALCSDGSVYSWGSNTYGALGNNSTTNSSLPVAVVLSGRSVQMIVAGFWQNLAKCSDGSLIGWGANMFAQLGISGGAPRLAPVTIGTNGYLTGKAVVALSSGYNFGAAACSDGTVAAWGTNSTGQVGNDSPLTTSQPVPVVTSGPLAGKTVISVSGTQQHCMALCSDGSVASWGDNAGKQLGVGIINTIYSNYTRVPVAVAGELPDLKTVAISTGREHSAAIVAVPANSKLARFELSSGQIVNTLETDVTDFSASVGHATASMNLKAVPRDPASRIFIQGDEIPPDNFSGPIPLSAGTTTVDVEVIAEDGLSTDYQLEIVRPATIQHTFAAAGDVAETRPAYNATGLTADFSLAFHPVPGTCLKVVDNTGIDFINGEFGDLPQGAEVALSFQGRTYRFIANYYGGTGNDLVLEWKRRKLMAWGYNSKGQLGSGSTANRYAPLAVDVSGVLAGKTVTAVSANGEHTLALCSDGTIAAWGWNNSSQLGNGYGSNSSVPVAVDMSGVLAGKKVVAVSAGANHSLALCSDGTVAAWGSNSGGILGTGLYDYPNVPVLVNTGGVLAGKKVVQISAGSDFSLVLCSDGTLAAWGTDNSGQLGGWQATSRSVPVRVYNTKALGSRRVTSISAGGSLCAVLCSDGAALGWGWTNQGEAGAGVAGELYIPTEVYRGGVLANKKLKALSAGNNHCIALCDDGSLVGWGSNYYGQYGSSRWRDYSLVPVNVPVAGVLIGKSVSSLVAAGSFSLMLCADGSLASMGNNDRGQLGCNKIGEEKVPVSVAYQGELSGRRVMKGNGRSSHGVALSALPAEAGLSALAVNGGKLAPGFSSDIRSYACAVPAGTASVTVSASAREASCQILIDGVLVPQGGGHGMPLPGTDTTIPVVVTAEDGSQAAYSIRFVKAAPIDGNFANASSIPVTAPVWNATGLAAHPLLGFAPMAGTSLTLVENTGPAPIVGEFSDLSQGQVVELLFNGVNYRYVVNYYGGTGNDLVLEWARNELVSWGANTSGQLGNGSLTSKLIPTSLKMPGVLNGKILTSVATGTSHSLALCSDGTVAAWGKNSDGQLGNDTTADAQMPVAVDQTGALAGKTVVAISAGYNHSLALCSDGTVFAWGDNASGQLGNGSTTDSNVPVPVATPPFLSGNPVTAISAGGDHSIALCSDGGVIFWGSSGADSGNGRTNSGLLPVPVDRTGALFGKTPLAIEAGSRHNLLLCSDGSLVTWGYQPDESNPRIYPGDDLPVPVNRGVVLAGKTVTSISAGSYHSLAVCSDGTMAAWGMDRITSLGSGIATSSALPVTVSTAGVLGGRAPVEASAGEYFSLVLCKDGTLSAWGANASGQMGDGTTTQATVPVRSKGRGMKPDGFIRKISAGELCGLAVLAVPADSKLAGLDVGSAMLKTPVFPYQKEYVAAAPGNLASTTVTAVAREPSSVVRVNGTVVSAGTSGPVVPLSSGINPVGITVTSEDGSVTAYQLDIHRSGNIDFTFPSADAVALNGAAFDAMGSSATLALGFAPAAGTDLTVINNTGHRPITGVFANLAQGQLVGLDFVGKTYQFTADYRGGTGNDLVLRWANRGVYGWGTNAAGQLGTTLPGSSRIPVAIADAGALAGKTVDSLATGLSHIVALCSDGTLVAWGNNSYGQLGNAGNVSSLLPVAVNTAGVLSGKAVVAISAGDYYTAALCSDGTVTTWGRNNSGQLGRGGTVSSNVPVEVTQTGTLAGRTVLAISAGPSHALALCADGGIVGWGLNGSGQLGDNSTTNRTEPVELAREGLLAWHPAVAISAGNSHGLALTTLGEPVSWGGGGLGDGTNLSSSTPVAVKTDGVLSGKSVSDISAGISHSLALCSDGLLVSWGSNNNSQLGNSAAGTSLVPVAVTTTGILSGKTVSSISARSDHSLALCSDGTAVAWGRNANGQLGNNSIANANAPVVLYGYGDLYGKRVGVVQAGVNFSLALASAPTEGYIAWLSGFRGIADKREGADPDGDGIPNLVEYVLHGHPGLTTPWIVPTHSSGGSDFVFNFNRIAASEGTTTQVFQYSTDMVHWSDVRITAPVDAGVGIGPVDGSGNQSVTVTVPKGANTTMFGRLQVARP